MKSESKLWAQLRAGLGDAWYSRIEAGRGGTPGNPDVLVLIDGVIVPIELKVGHLHEQRSVVFADVRPEQVLWHSKLWRAGGRSLFLIRDGSTCVVVPGIDAAKLIYKGADDFVGMINLDYESLRAAALLLLWPERA